MNNRDRISRDVERSLKTLNTLTPALVADLVRRAGTRAMPDKSPSQGPKGKGTWKDTELEKDFQERVCHLARLYHWRIYSIPDSRRVSLAGYPDLTMWNVEQKRLIFAELKREKGKVSESQKVVLSELVQIPHCEVYVWRPSDWDLIIEIMKGKP